MMLPSLGIMLSRSPCTCVLWLSGCWGLELVLLQWENKKNGSACSGTWAGFRGPLLGSLSAPRFVEGSCMKCDVV